MIKLVATDMDGTLLNSKHELPDRLIPVTRALRKRGVRFAVASGRSYINVREKIGDAMDDFLCICENGACIYEADKCLYAAGLPIKHTVELVQKVRTIPEAHIILCCVNGAYTEPIENPDDERLLREFYGFATVVPDVLEAAGHDTFCKATIFTLKNAEEFLVPRLAAAGSSMHMAVSGDHFLDFNRPDVNKGEALRQLEEICGVLPEEIMAFGDQLNDLEMVKECGYGYAMGNAHEDVKRAARFLAKSNDEDGVMEAIIEAFHLNGEELQQ